LTDAYKTASMPAWLYDAIDNLNPPLSKPFWKKIETLYHAAKGMTEVKKLE
jgi:hypothetical protein